MTHLILEWLQPALTLIIEAGAAAVLTLLARYIPLVARLYSDQRNRDALHKAIDTGVDRALAAGELAVGTVPGVAAIDLALSYVEKSVPGAIKHFFKTNADAARDQITQMIVAKMGAKAAPMPVAVEAGDPLAEALTEAMAIRN
ncbi:hypothetical protein DRW48_10615 [Paracoccus suum]|uniref:Uncharacterized protein n=1 Tax=Paracoccus suum TaxID=2259340 RepID=A0A344PL32_9RHOB|nr:hypothetical protein [Paracoccus suum]AXC50087.1 hypothetical protein DRW48_10615 [Paracoccus suum]